ncbi:hypothetical protein GCM10020254_01660 [Streptomyces goshikiensis]
MAPLRRGGPLLLQLLLLLLFLLLLVLLLTLLALLALADPLALRHRVLAALHPLAHVPDGGRGQPRPLGDLPQRDPGRVGQQPLRLPPALRGAQRPDLPVAAEPALGGRLHRAGDAAPQRGHRVRGQPRDRGDGPVRPVAVRLEDPYRRGRPLGQGQRQPVPGVGLHGVHEGVLRAAVEELDLDLRTAAQQRGPEAVHPVDDPHRGPVHDDRRQPVLRDGQGPQVLRVLGEGARGIGGLERGDGHQVHRGEPLRARRLRALVVDGAPRPGSGHRLRPFRVVRW